MSGKYRTIVADPPWPLPWSGGAALKRNGRGEWHRNKRGSVRALEYPTLSVDAICELPVSDLAEPDAHLYLWTTDMFALDGSAKRVAEAWGFPCGRLLVWAKSHYGLGRFPRPQHELVLVCRRGKLPFAIANEGSVHRWPIPFVNGIRLHSAKPDAFGDLVERASPGPYLELFARRQRLGWDTWGDEALAHVEISTARLRTYEPPPVTPELIARFTEPAA